jgi:hypothetical protein
MKSRTSHRSTRVAGTVTGLAVALSLAYGAASFADGPPAGNGQPVTRINLSERELQVRNIDQGKHGISQGDGIVIMSEMLDANRHRVGRADFVCTVTGSGRNKGGLCQGAITLADGQLTGQFAFGASGFSSNQAITGGTGSYEGARGQFVLAEGKDGLESVVVELLG